MKNLEDMTNYFHNSVGITPRKGDLLISEPFLPDPNFERTVVLICENNEDGICCAFSSNLNEREENHAPMALYSMWMGNRRGDG